MEVAGSATEGFDLTAFCYCLLWLSLTFVGVMFLFWLPVCYVALTHSLNMPYLFHPYGRVQTDATQFAILADGSCLLFCFTLIGQSSEIHHSVLWVGE